MNTKFTWIVPEGSTTAQLRLRGNGTGPFMQEKFVPGGPFRILRHNANYWKAGLPKAQCLKISVTQEPVTMIAAVKSGEVDMVTAVAPSAIPVLEKEPSVNLIETAAGTHPTFAMYIDTPPFNDVRVRQALKLVIDRQMMVDTAMLGYAEPGNDSPVPPTSPNNFSSVVPKRDIAKAKKLLAEAGIKINLIVRPADGYWEDTWMKLPFVVSGWSRRPPLAIIGLIYSKEAKWNETHWNRQDFEALVSKANRTMDTQKRTQVVKKALRLLAEEGGAIVPYFMHNMSSFRKNCSGYEPHVQTFIFNYENLVCN